MDQPTSRAAAQKQALRKFAQSSKWKERPTLAATGLLLATIAYGCQQPTKGGSGEQTDEKAGSSSSGGSPGSGGSGGANPGGVDAGAAGDMATTNPPAAGDSGGTAGDSGGTAGDSGGTAGDSGGTAGDSGGTAGEAGVAGAGGADATQALSVIWREDFEGDAPDWSIDGGLWAIGTPTGAGAPEAFGGTKVASTGLAQNYGFRQTAYLRTPAFLVPKASEKPRLRYHYWYNFGDNGYGQLAVRTVGGAWSPLAETVAQGGKGQWRQAIVDLSAYANVQIEVGFAVWTGTNSNPNRGWFIDDVQLEIGTQSFASPEGFENGFEDWSVEGGVWAIGAPDPAGPGVVGPGAAHTGERLAGTELTGSFGFRQSARLVTPEFVVASATSKPSLRYSYWYEFQDNGTGQVQVSIDGGDWTDIAGAGISQSGGGVWRTGKVDLIPYANQTVRIGFLAWSGTNGNTAPGWFIDDVALLQ